MNLAANTWRAQGREEEVRLDTFRDTVRRLVENHAHLARHGDAEAVAWLRSSRCEACCQYLGLPVDELRAAFLSPDDDPTTPVGNMLRDPAAMEKLIAIGMSQRAIAKHLEVSRCTVQYWIKRHGLADEAHLTTRHEDTAREAA